MHLLYWHIHRLLPYQYPHFLRDYLSLHPSFVDNPPSARSTLRVGLYDAHVYLFEHQPYHVTQTSDDDVDDNDDVDINATIVLLWLWLTNKI